MRFLNKVVIITGGSSGIGASTALLMSKEGAKVVIVGRNETKLKQVEEESMKAGNKVYLIKADVSKDEDAKRIIEETIDKFGSLDVLVNNAGIVRFGTILGKTGGELFGSYDEVMNTNVRAAMLLIKYAAPHLIKTKGNIVNVSSILGKSLLGSLRMMAYCASKAALDMFSKGAALELGAHGVRVNIVSPGPVMTDIMENAGVSNNDWDSHVYYTLLKRISKSEEVAKIIAFLASDDAVGVTGSDYGIDNGTMLVVPRI